MIFEAAKSRTGFRSDRFSRSASQSVYDYTLLLVLVSHMIERKITIRREKVAEIEIRTHLQRLGRVFR